MTEPLTKEAERKLIWAACQLGLLPPFTLTVARDRYRELAKAYHPDAGRNANEQRFKDVGEAIRLVEQHESFFAAKSLAWDTGARASAATEWIDKLAAAEREIATKEADLIKMRSNQEFLRRELSGRRGIPLWVGVVGYGLLIVAILAVVMLTMSKSTGTLNVPQQSITLLPDATSSAAFGKILHHKVLFGEPLAGFSADVTLDVALTSASLELTKDGALVYDATTGTLVTSDSLRIAPEIDVKITDIQVTMTAYHTVVQDTRLEDPWVVKPLEGSQHGILRRGLVYVPEAKITSASWEQAPAALAGVVELHRETVPTTRVDAIPVKDPPRYLDAYDWSRPDGKWNGGKYSVPHYHPARTP